MKEDESNWFSNWEDELPSPEELIPLSQTLIPPDLALAFNIQNPQIPNNSAEFDSSEFVGGGSEEPARTLKRPRLVWTPQLHKRFVDAVAHLGIKNAVPKTIMQLMSVEGLTRENVASHLQKYRLYLKRMQGISAGGGATAGGDPATDRLFASSPVPPHFLTAMQLPHRRHVATGAGNAQFPSQFGQISHFGLQPNTQMENPFFLGRQQQAPSFVEDVDSGARANGRKVLTLFPTGDE